MYLSNMPWPLSSKRLTVRDNIFLVVDNRGKAYWPDQPSRISFSHSLTEETLIAYVEYLVDNIYVCVGNRVYRQCVAVSCGIPMGTDCAHLLANLFLFYYEYNYTKKSIKQDIWGQLEGQHMLYVFSS